MRSYSLSLRSNLVATATVQCDIVKSLWNQVNKCLTWTKCSILSRFINIKSMACNITMGSAGTCESVLISLISNYEDLKSKEFHVIPKPIGKLNCGRMAAIFVSTVIRWHPNQMMATNTNGSFKNFSLCCMHSYFWSLTIRLTPSCIVRDNCLFIRTLLMRKSLENT